MRNYKITEEIINLVEELFQEGYGGTVELVNTFPSGIGLALAGCTVVQLSGFCKESLYLCHDSVTDQLIAFGRYGIERSWDKGEVTVRDIVNIAMCMFNIYEGLGYSCPYEFKDLFIKYGFMEEQTVTKIVRK